MLVASCLLWDVCCLLFVVWSFGRFLLCAVCCFYNYMFFWRYGARRNHVFVFLSVLCCVCFFEKYVKQKWVSLSASYLTPKYTLRSVRDCSWKTWFSRAHGCHGLLPVRRKVNYQKCSGTAGVSLAVCHSQHNCTGKMHVPLAVNSMPPPPLLATTILGLQKALFIGLFSHGPVGQKWNQNGFQKVPPNLAQKFLQKLSKALFPNTFVVRSQVVFCGDLKL